MVEEMKTVVVGIGNSDNKLTQEKWASIIHSVDTYIQLNSIQTHFAGFSPGDATWQNACWMADVKDKKVNELRECLKLVGKIYDQDSIAFIVGDTEFLGETKHE